MNEFEPDLLETELQRLRPATPPEDFMARLAGALIAPRHQAASPKKPRPDSLGHLLKWLAPLTAAAALLALLAIHQPRSSADKRPNRIASILARPSVKADDVEIDQQLVATFDAVALLPNGEPVRFRCSEWFDDVVLRDSSRGLLIQHRMPRVQVEQVSFETY